MSIDEATNMSISLLLLSLFPMMISNFDHSSHSSVGKSCIVLRFVGDSFLHNYINTIRMDFKICTKEKDKKSIKVQIWNSTSHERLWTVTGNYYLGGHGIIVVYDVSEQERYQ
ncbi:Ras-related protein RIC1, partial [Mucuna pruriens]